MHYCEHLLRACTLSGRASRAPLAMFPWRCLRRQGSLGYVSVEVSQAAGLKHFSRQRLDASTSWLAGLLGWPAVGCRGAREQSTPVTRTCLPVLGCRGIQGHVARYRSGDQALLGPKPVRFCAPRVQARGEHGGSSAHADSISSALRAVSLQGRCPWQLTSMDIDIARVHGQASDAVLKILQFSVCFSHSRCIYLHQGMRGK